MQSVTVLNARTLLVWSLAAWCAQTHAMAEIPGSYFVNASNLNVRLEPQVGAAMAGQLKRKQKIQVYEVKNGWARISQYYPSRSLNKDVAQWVSASFLVKTEAKIRNNNSRQAVLLRKP